MKNSKNIFYTILQVMFSLLIVMEVCVLAIGPFMNSLPVPMGHDVTMSYWEAFTSDRYSDAEYLGRLLKEIFSWFHTLFNYQFFPIIFAVLVTVGTVLFQKEIITAKMLTILVWVEVSFIFNRMYLDYFNIYVAEVIPALISRLIPAVIILALAVVTLVEATKEKKRAKWQTEN